MTSAATGRLRRVAFALAVAVSLVFAAPLAARAANTVGGRPAGAAPPAVAIILLDTNASFYPSAFRAEKQAALAYARALPGYVPTGLITYNVHWHLVLSPTTDRNRLAAALQSASTAGGVSTGLYGGLASAVSMANSAHPAGPTRFLVLSDAEELSGPPPAEAFPVDAVTWFLDSDDHLGVVRKLSSYSGGSVATPAAVATLGWAFTRGAVRVSVMPRLPLWSASLIEVLAIVFAALFLVALLLVAPLFRGDQRRRLFAQIERYGPRHAPAPAESQEGEGSVSRAALDVTQRALRSTGAERGLARRLELAGISRTPAEWALLCAAVCAGAATFVLLATGNVLVSVLAGIVVGWLAMRLLVSFRIHRRRSAFNDQLPDVLQLVAASLQSGFSLPQALDAVVREDNQPAAGEFSRALAEARIGIDLDVALDGVADRMDSTDLGWTVMAIRIQRQVGGNLAEVLRTTVGTMRERGYLRRQVRSLSAEGRLSAYILSVLPVVVGGWMFFIDPSYMRPLFTTPIGLAMLVVTVVLYGIGVFWMRNVIKVEV